VSAGCRTDSSADCSALPGVSSDRPSDRSYRGTLGSTLGSSTLGSLRGGLFDRLVRVETCLLFSPFITGELILVLLVFRLIVLGKDKDITCRNWAGDENNETGQHYDADAFHHRTSMLFVRPSIAHEVL
jgi:hypothetical protein